MKNIVLIASIVATVIVVSAFKQANRSISDDVPKEIFQRWKLDYGESEGVRISGLPQSPDFDYLFKEDHTYTLYFSNGNNFEAKWKYDKAAKQILLITEDGEVNGRVGDITAERITLIPDGSAVKNTPFEKVRYYYVPKN